MLPCPTSICFEKIRHGDKIYDLLFDQFDITDEKSQVNASKEVLEALGIYLKIYKTYKIYTKTEMWDPFPKYKRNESREPVYLRTEIKITEDQSKLHGVKPKHGNGVVVPQPVGSGGADYYENDESNGFHIWKVILNSKISMIRRCQYDGIEYLFLTEYKKYDYEIDGTEIDTPSNFTPTFDPDSDDEKNKNSPENPVKKVKSETVMVEKEFLSWKPEKVPEFISSIEQAITDAGIPKVFVDTYVDGVVLNRLNHKKMIQMGIKVF